MQSNKVKAIPSDHRLRQLSAHLLTINGVEFTEPLLERKFCVHCDLGILVEGGPSRGDIFVVVVVRIRMSSQGEYSADKQLVIAAAHLVDVIVHEFEEQPLRESWREGTMPSRNNKINMS